MSTLIGYLVIAVLAFLIGIRFGEKQLVDRNIEELIDSVRYPHVLKLGQPVMDLISSLKKRAGGTDKGIIIAGLQILKWAIDQQDQGLSIVAVALEDNDDRPEWLENAPRFEP